MNNRKTPRIRFKEYTDDWEQRKFDKVFDGLQNNTLSRADLNYESGTVKNVHYGDVLIKFGDYIDASKIDLPYIADDTKADKFKSSFLQDGDIIIADTAEDDAVGKCTEIQCSEGLKLLSGLHTIACRPKEKNGPMFLGYYINSPAYHNQLKPLMQGIKVTSISKSALQNTYMIIPKSIDEQITIGKYFSNLDHLITLHQRKLEKLKIVKKAMLENCFPKNGEKVPKFRFSGFTGDWEQRKLGEIVERVTRKNENFESALPLTISAQYGLIDQNEFFDKRIASKDVSGYYLVRKGEFAYNKSTSSDAPWGAIKRLDKYESGVLSTLYIVFQIRDESIIDSDYLVTYYDTDLWHKGVQAIAAEGARNHGLLNIAPADFFETTISMPKNIEEQRKTGAYFKSLDHLITLHQRKLEKLKIIKKSFLEKMFV